MKHISTGQFSAFVDELQKEAGIGSWLSKTLVREAPGAPLRLGRQLMLGGGLGAVTGAATADPNDRFRGAVRGAIVGGGITAAGQMAHPVARAQHLQSAQNFLTRTMYGLTGKGLGHYPDPLEAARKAGIVRPISPDVAPPTLLEGSGKIVELQNAMRKAKHVNAIERSIADIDAFDKGYMHLPGLTYGLATNPKEVLRLGWQRMTPGDKALTALGGFEAARQAFTPSEEGGPGRAERSLGAMAGVVGAAVAPAGIIPMLATSTLAAKAGGGIGRLLDRTATKTPQQEPHNILSQPLDTSGLAPDYTQVPVGG